MPQLTSRRIIARLSFAIAVSTVTSLSAAPINWTGGATGTSQTVTTNSNWSSTPGATDDLVIANRTNGNSSGNYIAGGGSNALIIATNYASKSLTFDNADQQFNNGTITMRGNTSANVVWTFGTADTTILAFANNIAVTLNRGNSTGPQSLSFNLNYSGNSAIDVDSTSSVTVNNATLDGTGGLIKTGAGILSLGGNSTYQGGFRLDAGTVRVAATGSNTSTNVTNSAFGTGTLTLKGGTLQSSSTTSRTIQNAVQLDGTVSLLTSGTGNLTIDTGAGKNTTLLSNSTLDVDVGTGAAGSNLSWNQKISGGFELTKRGAGRIVLSGTNDYTGGFRLENGTVELAAGASSSGGAIVGSAFGTGTLTLTGGTIENGHPSTTRLIYNSVNLDGTVTITSASSAALTVSSAGGGSTTLLSNSILNVPGTLTWSQAIDGGAFSLTKTGAGTLTLTQAGSFSGGLNITAGTVVTDAPGNLGSGAVTLDNATLQFSVGSIASTSSRSYRMGTNGGTIDIPTGINQTINGDLENAPSQTGTLTKIGAGTLVLNGTGSYSGATTVSDGTLTVGGTLGGSSVALSSGATLAGTGTVSAATTLAVGASLASTSLTFNSSLDLSAIAGTAAHSLLFTLTSPGASDTATINGLLSLGNGGLTLDDFSLNTSALSGPGTYTLFQSSQAISGLLGDAGSLTTSLGGYNGTLGLSGDSTALQLTVSAIPEPSTYALVLAAAAGLAVVARRRRTAQK